MDQNASELAVQAKVELGRARRSECGSLNGGKEPLAQARLPRIIPEGGLGDFEICCG